MLNAQHSLVGVGGISMRWVGQIAYTAPRSLNHLIASLQPEFASSLR